MAGCLLNLGWMFAVNWLYLTNELVSSLHDVCLIMAGCWQEIDLILVDILLNLGGKLA